LGVAFDRPDLHLSAPRACGIRGDRSIRIGITHAATVAAKGAAEMTPTLCVVLPLRNADSSIESDVQSVLDTAEQIGVPFEIRVIDVGSRDDTLSTVTNLARRYPQLAVTSVPPGTSFESILDRARDATRAEWLCIHRGRGPIRAGEIDAIWQEHRLEVIASRLRPRIEASTSAEQTDSVRRWAIARRASIQSRAATVGFLLAPREKVAIQENRQPLATRLAVANRLGKTTPTRKGRASRIARMAALALAE